jgi:hypothetical protein
MYERHALNGFFFTQKRKGYTKAPGKFLLCAFAARLCAFA